MKIFAAALAILFWLSIGVYIGGHPLVAQCNYDITDREEYSDCDDFHDSYSCNPGQHCYVYACDDGSQGPPETEEFCAFSGWPCWYYGIVYWAVCDG